MNSFTLTFNLDEMKVIDMALGNMPYKEVAGIIASINEQIRTANENKKEADDVTTKNK